MDEPYRIEDTSQIISPGLVVFRDLVERNIEGMVRIAGDASRLRPHCKTHKMREVVRLQMDLGITKHKCATLAEAEMLAEEGVALSPPDLIRRAKSELNAVIPGLDLSGVEWADNSGV